MASLSDVLLTITTNSNGNSSNVNVSGKIGFDAGEIGKSYRLEIKLFGEDKAGDKLPSSDAVGDDELYVFKWNLLFSYKTITVTNAGIQNFSYTRTLPSNVLDEDAGTVKIGEESNTPVFMPRGDEIYATVFLSAAPVSARSQTVTTPGK